ncbi:MAG: efflux RND transporter periplasmic adaptor subunit [Victivallaceae bacterium]|nr:efflux RND transporter periplasmic adaptor subunit [Victivallaceae bacterium]
MMSFKRGKTALAVAVVLLAVAGGAAWYFLASGKPAHADGKNPLDRTYTVKRGELVLGFSASGTVNARKKYQLRLEANRQTKLMWVIDENTHVKEGEVLAKFDAEDLRKNIENLSIELDNLEKELEVQLQQRTIQNSTDDEAIRTAKDRLSDADDALRKYRRYELRNSRDAFDAKISEAETALTAARNAYNEYREQIATASSSDATEKAKMAANLETKKKAIDTAEKTLESAESSRKVFLRYDKPSKFKTLINAVDQAKLNLEKVQVQINSTKVQNQRQIDNMKRRIGKQRDDLEEQQSFLPMMELKAPVDGVVLYGDPDDQWSRTEVKLGMDIYRGMVLMTIPDMRKLLVEFDLPEMYRSKVTTGNDVIVTPDSLQGVKMKGKIDEISTLPSLVMRWDPNSPKIYKSKIEVEDEKKELVSGMSVQLEIVSGIIKDVICVPVEAVFEEGEEFFVYVSSATGASRQPVKLGRSNDSMVEITDGLEDGDVVYLYRPFQKREGN